MQSNCETKQNKTNLYPFIAFVMIRDFRKLGTLSI